jgi:hypothetical protein
MANQYAFTWLAKPVDTVTVTISLPFRFLNLVSAMGI